MFKATIVVYSMLLWCIISAEVYEFDNFIEYDQPNILPYPYRPVEPVRPIYNYNHPKIIVPASTEVVEVVEPAGLISTAVTCVFNVVKSVVVFFITRIPALIAGIAGALGLCKITSLCDSQITIYEAQMELRSLATPERITRAVDFVKEALKKYNEMQNN